MHGAAHCRVEERAGESAVYAADGVVVLLAGLALEDDPSLLDLVQSETDEMRQRRCG